ncbi:MAG TPA: hypothetical protein VFS22_00740 [Flavisolibacter sp.]|nr:hypothetical protein [Flavisolibacter sp.]
MKQKYLLLTAGLLASLSFVSCVTVAPVNAGYENAGTLGKGNVELSGNYTHYVVSSEGESEAINNNYGFKAGLGLSDRFDVKLRYEKLIPVNLEEDSKFKANYVSVIPKVSLKDRKLSFLMPVSRYDLTDEDLDGKKIKDHSYSIAPQIIRTFTSKTNQADFSIGVKGDYIINTGEDAENDFLLGFNIGAGFSNNLNKWAIRPEVGYLFKPGDGIGFWNMGVGVQFILPTGKKQ